MNPTPGNDAEQPPPLKQRLVAVAAQLLTQPRATKLPTMREIASQAGVAPGAAYRHFASQEDLFMAVVTQLFGELERALMMSVISAGPPELAVNRIAHAYVDWGLRNAGGYQFLFERTDGDELLATGARPGLHMIEQLARLFSRGSIPTSDDLSRATRLWTSMHGLVSLRTHKTGMTWPNTVDEDIAEIVRRVS